MSKPVKRIINQHPSEWPTPVKVKSVATVTSATPVAMNVAAKKTTTTTLLTALLTSEDMEFPLQAVDDPHISVALTTPTPTATQMAAPISTNPPSPVKNVHLLYNDNSVQLYQNTADVPSSISQSQNKSAVQPSIPQRELTITHSIPMPSSKKARRISTISTIVQSTSTPTTIAQSIPKTPGQSQSQLPQLAKQILTENELNTNDTIQPVSLLDFDINNTENCYSDEDGYSNIDFEDDEYQLIEPKEDVDEYDPVWSPALLAPCKVFIYDGKLQPNLKETAPYSPLAYFDMIIGPRRDFFSIIANSCNANSGKKISKSFTLDELQIFMGICLQMSSLRLHHLNEYWDKNANFGFNGIDNNKMTLDRFKAILEVLSFNKFKTPTMAPNNVLDKFVDVRPLLEFFSSRMKEIYDCDRSLILNEPMLYWKGKLNWLHDVNTKFRSNAVLLHFLTEPSGLILKIVPDLESDERKDFSRNSKDLVQQRLAIAMEVLQSNTKKGHIVYASKYYSSFALALELAKHQTYCAGYFDATRHGNCKELLFTSLEEEGCTVRFADGIIVGKYRPKQKSCYFYSSDCQAVIANEKEKVEKSISNLMLEIKTQLSPNPDTHSKMLNCQILFPSTEINWDKRLIIYVFNLMVLNAYILYTKHAKLLDGELPLRYEKFRQVVTASLMNTCLKKIHIIQVLPRINGKIAKKKCQICSKRGLNKYSEFFCKMCLGMPGLCNKPCFRIWHEQMH